MAGSPQERSRSWEALEQRETTQRSAQDQVLFLIELKACHRSLPQARSCFWLTWPNLHPLDTYCRSRCLVYGGCSPLPSSGYLDLATCLIDSITYTAVNCSLFVLDVKIMNVIKDFRSREESMMFNILYHLR